MSQAKLDKIRAASREEITDAERDAARALLASRKVAVFIPGYNVEGQVASVFDRIPDDLRPLFAEIFVIDNCSPDGTSRAAEAARARYPELNIHVFRTPSNRGYGGNQKVGYLYCIEKGYDYVVMLHGDGQYAPEYLPRVLAGFAGGADAVFGSRMIDKKMALQGGMPLYKWLGNQVLTSFENRLLGTRLSEFHTGYRAFSVEALRRIPFVHNSDDFHFDTEIIIQMVGTGWRIKEVAIPAHYGDESNNVNGIKYALDCMKAVVRYTLVNIGLLYERNYDFGPLERDKFCFKKSPWSLHQYLAGNATFGPDAVTVELGAGSGELSAIFSGKAGRHVAADRESPPNAGGALAVRIDPEGDFSETLGRRAFDSVFALDIIEHMKDPEKFLLEALRTLKPGGKLYISTANVCYFPSRLLLLFGQASYGKIGNLDKSHSRLFTIASLKKLLAQQDFRPVEVVGFPPPLTDLVSDGPKMRFVERMHAFLSRKLPGLFAYHFLVVADRLDATDEVYEATVTPRPDPPSPCDAATRFPPQTTP